METRRFKLTVRPRQVLLIIALGIASPVMIGGCQGCNVQVKAIDLTPSPWKTENQFVTTEDCSFWCLGLCPVGLPGPFPRERGEVVVGFSNAFSPGTDPFPCSDAVNGYYRGGARFELDQFDAIGSAALFFNFHKTEWNLTPPPADDSAAARLVLLKANDIQSNNTFNPVDFIASVSHARDHISPINVTDVVKAELARGHKQINLVLVSDEDPGPNNKEWLSWYGDFRLNVIYNPKLNPRAPQ
jgi:hypothetical protein